MLTHNDLKSALQPRLEAWLVQVLKGAPLRVRRVLPLAVAALDGPPGLRKLARALGKWLVDGEIGEVAAVTIAAVMSEAWTFWQSLPHLVQAEQVADQRNVVSDGATPVTHPREYARSLVELFIEILAAVLAEASGGSDGGLATCFERSARIFIARRPKCADTLLHHLSAIQLRSACNIRRLSCNTAPLSRYRLEFEQRRISSAVPIDLVAKVTEIARGEYTFSDVPVRLTRQRWERQGALLEDVVFSIFAHYLPLGCPSEQGWCNRGPDGYIRGVGRDSNIVIYDTKSVTASATLVSLSRHRDRIRRHIQQISDDSLLFPAAYLLIAHAFTRPSGKLAANESGALSTEHGRPISVSLWTTGALLRLCLLYGPRWLPRRTEATVALPKPRECLHVFTKLIHEHVVDKVTVDRYSRLVKFW